MGAKSRRKGSGGQREWAAKLRELGLSPNARNGAQGGVLDGLDIHNDIEGCRCEVKRVESLNLAAAKEQAVRSAGDAVPYIAHRRNREQWWVYVPAERLIEFASRVFTASQTPHRPEPSSGCD